MRSKHRVLIIDDHPAIREGHKQIIAADGAFEVVAEAGSAGEGLTKARDHKPDLALMDISLPDGSGLGLISELRAILPDTRVLVCSMHDNTDYVDEAFKAGAHGFLTKDAMPGEMLEGLRRVTSGSIFLGKKIANKVALNRIPARGDAGREPNDAHASLTKRERQVMRLIVEGKATKEIADIFSVSERTVGNQRQSLMNKLDLHGPIQLARYAMRIGIIDPEEWACKK